MTEQFSIGESSFLAQRQHVWWGVRPGACLSFLFQHFWEWSGSPELLLQSACSEMSEVKKRNTVVDTSISQHRTQVLGYANTIFTNHLDHSPNLPPCNFIHFTKMKMKLKNQLMKSSLHGKWVRTSQAHIQRFINNNYHAKGWNPLLLTLSVNLHSTSIVQFIILLLQTRDPLLCLLSLPSNFL